MKILLISILSLPTAKLSSNALARFLTLLLVAWQPFIGDARLPSVLLLALGVWLLAHKRINFSTSSAKRLGLIWLLLFIPILVTIPGSFNIVGSIETAVVLVLFYIVGLVVMQGLGCEANHAWLQRWLGIILLTWLADGYIQYFFGHDLMGIPLSENNLVLGPFADNLHFGIFITVLMPVMLWRITKERPFLALILIALIGFIVGMSARSNMLFFVLASATLMPRFNWSYRIYGVLGLAVALLTSILISPSGIERVKQFNALKSETETSLVLKLDHFMSGRLIIWETASEMIKDRPLTGVGTNAFAEAYDHYAKRSDDPFRGNGSYPGGVYHAHQMYISIAAESGLIGLTGLLAIIAFCIKWLSIVPIKQRALAGPYAASLAVIVFPIQSQPVLYTIWWFPIVLLLLCGMIAALDKKS